MSDQLLAYVARTANNSGLCPLVDLILRDTRRVVYPGASLMEAV